MINMARGVGSRVTVPSSEFSTSCNSYSLCDYRRRRAERDVWRWPPNTPGEMECRGGFANIVLLESMSRTKIVADVPSCPQILDC
jgi:hypothetical protein